MANGAAIKVNGGGYGLILQIVTVVSIFIGGFWAGVISPISERENKLELKMESYVARAEHEEFKLRIDKDITEVKDQILRLRALVVPRSENEVRWKAQEENAKLISDRLNELRVTTTSTYTVRDEVQRLEKQLSDLQAKLIAK